MPATRGSSYFDPIPPISVVPTTQADPQPTMLLAQVQTHDGRGNQVSGDPSRFEAVDIKIRFRKAIDIAPDALHAYIDITRANGAHQVLAAYPVGGMLGTHEGGQLTFQAGNERGQTDLAQLTLKTPPGMTCTQYADALVAGAKAYNTHPVRYDGLGEDGHNSNAWVSSLVVAKGGATGLNDLRRAASFLDTSPIRTDPKVHPMDDKAMANLIRYDLHYGHGREVIPGLGNATINVARFTRNPQITPDPKPWLPQVNTLFQAAHAGVSEAYHSHLWGAREPHPTSPPFVQGDGVHVHIGKQSYEVGPGFHASGRIQSVQNDCVLLQTQTGDIKLSYSDLHKRSENPKAMERTLKPGNHVDISIDNNSIVHVGEHGPKLTHAHTPHMGLRIRL